MQRITSCACIGVTVTVSDCFFLQLLPIEDVLQLLHVTQQSKLYMRLVSRCRLHTLVFCEY